MNKRRGAGNKNGRRGFTLVELLVTVAILGLLASLTVLGIDAAKRKSRDNKRITDLTGVQKAVELFNNSYGYYPTPYAPNGTSMTEYWEVYFAQCIEQGIGCDGIQNSSISGFLTPLKGRLPQDQFKNIGYSYHYGYPGCQYGFRLHAQLEDNSHSILSNDVDGSYYNNNNGCADSNGGYCIGQGDCAGW